MLVSWRLGTACCKQDQRAREQAQGELCHQPLLELPGKLPHVQKCEHAQEGTECALVVCTRLPGHQALDTSKGRHRKGPQTVKPGRCELPDIRMCLQPTDTLVLSGWRTHSLGWGGSEHHVVSKHCEPGRLWASWMTRQEQQ